MTSASTLSVRPAGPADAAGVVALFDDAVRWLTAQGYEAQWGATPWSDVPQRVAAVEGWCTGSGAWVAETDDDALAGLLVLGDAPEYVPPADVPEVYVVALVGSQRPEGKGSGRQLLGLADRVARERGVRQLRVDCFAGNGGRLVRFSESAGYERTDTFLVGDWTGQVLRRLVPS